MKSKEHQRRLLQDVRRALALIDVRLRKSAFGHLDGVDELDLGLDVLAKALAAFFELRIVDVDDAPKISDVLAYLVANHQVDADEGVRTRTLLDAVLDGIKRSTYDDGLKEEEIERVEASRRELYDRLVTWYDRLARGIDSLPGDLPDA